MAALGTPNHLALGCRLGAAPAAGYPGIGFAESEPALGTLDNIFELHIYENSSWRVYKGYSPFTEYSF